MIRPHKGRRHFHPGNRVEKRRVGTWPVTESAIDTYSRQNVDFLVFTLYISSCSL